MKKKYVITSVHHERLGGIGSEIELDDREFALLPYSAYLKAGMDASIKNITNTSVSSGVGVKKGKK